MKVGIALGSGSARGIAHIGVLQAFEELQIPINLIAGSSMGAFVGAAYASGQKLDQIKSISEKATWQETVRMFLPSFSKGGLVKGKRISGFIREVIGADDFEELSVPLGIDTTDLETGEKYTITAGNLVNAVRASMAVPTVLTPKIIDGRILVDGGLVSPVPIQTVRDMGADIVIAVDVLPPIRANYRRSRFVIQDSLKEIIKQNSALQRLIGENRLPTDHKITERDVGIFDVFQQSMNIGHTKLAEYQVALEKPDILIRPDTKDYSAHEFHKGHRLIEKAYELSLEILSKNRGLFG
jgi:NTE family protein